MNLSCGKGEGNKDLGIDGILFTRHCRKLLQILSLQGERYFKLRSLWEGTVFQTNISYWGLFSLSWTFFLPCFSWHYHLSSLPISLSASQPRFSFPITCQQFSLSAPLAPRDGDASFAFYPLPSVLPFFHSSTRMGPWTSQSSIPRFCHVPSNSRLSLSRASHVCVLWADGRLHQDDL